MMSINIQPAGNWLAGLVDCEHGTTTDLTPPALTTHPVTQEGDNIVLRVYEK